ncbi:MAG: hypothetical protein ABIT05_01405 [Chitinophagaceae bacterium]
MKYFRMSYEYVLWGISFANVNMLLATIPGLETDQGEEKTETVESLSDLQKFFN